jgi:transposase
MSKERRRFTREFKIKVAEAYASGVSAVELSRQFELHPNVIYEWSRQYRKDPAHAFEGGTGADASSGVDEQRVAELERMIGRLTLENEFLKKALTAAKSILLKDKAGSSRP